MTLVCKTTVLLVFLIKVGVLSEPASAQQESRPVSAQKVTEAKRQGDPYYLATCPVSGEKLGSMGDPVIKIYDGREVRFCCEGCISKFEKNQAASLIKLDEIMKKDQLLRYPLKTSVVSGKALPEKSVDFVHNNRLVRLVDSQEKEQFLEDSARHLRELDKAVISRGKEYPLKTCVVSGEEFGGSMGAPLDLVVANRLIRICCKGCRKDLEKTPAEFLAKVDLADKKLNKESGQEGAKQSVTDK